MVCLPCFVVAFSLTTLTSQSRVWSYTDPQLCSGFAVHSVGSSAIPLCWEGGAGAGVDRHWVIFSSWLCSETMPNDKSHTHRWENALAYSFSKTSKNGEASKSWCGNEVQICVCDTETEAHGHTAAEHVCCSCWTHTKVITCHLHL